MNHLHTQIMADLMSRAKRYQWDRKVSDLRDLEDALLEVVDFVHAMVAHVPVTEEKNGAQ